MIRIKYTHSFRQDLKNLLESDPSSEKRVDQAVSRFVKNPNDTRIQTHALKKRLKGKNAFSVTDDIRIVFEWLGKNQARFLAIGPHHQVYPGYRKRKN